AFSLGIGNIGLRQDIDWFLGSAHTLRLGWEVKSLDIFDRLQLDTTRLLDISSRPFYSGIYTSDKWRLTPALGVELGLRGEYFSSGRYLRLAPRLGAKYLLPSDLALKAGYGHFYQYLSIPYPRDEMMMKLPVSMLQQYLPADSAYQPIQAIHYTLGAEKWLSNELSTSLEAYYKTLSNVLETDMPLALPFLGESIAFRSGSGWAAGIELLVKWKTSYLGYALGWTRRTFDSTSFYPVFDSRHNLNLAWGIPLGRGWTVSLQWLLRTGFPYTGVIGRYQEVPLDGEYGCFPWAYINGRRGDTRYPPYHRLDLAIEKTIRLLRANWTAYFQVVNVYAQKNVLFYNYYEDSDGRIKREAVTMLPWPIPGFGLRGSF
ncbi:MAG: TonB-dependent receptor, partial [candidate division WOR-3 bacterium]